MLAGSGRPARDFAIGLALFGLPLALVGGAPVTVLAVVALGVLGIGNSIVDVNALTIMQRAVPDAVLGRALGALDGLLLGSLGIGAMLAPALIAVIGPEASLVAASLVLPVLAFFTRPRLREGLWGRRGRHRRVPDPGSRLLAEELLQRLEEAPPGVVVGLVEQSGDAGRRAPRCRRRP